MDSQTDKPIIMVVDDTIQDLQLLEEILTKHNFQVLSFPRGILALRALSSSLPDVILLDIRMSEMDGFEVCRQLKADKKLRDIPVIFISVLDDIDSKVKAFTEGGVDYITKPFQEQEIISRLNTHITLRRKLIEIEKQRQQLQQNYEQLQELEQQRDKLVHMIVHDMRSPIATILMALDLLENYADLKDEKVLKIYNSAKKSIKNLKNLVDQMLDINRLESGQMPLNKTKCDLRLLVDDVVKSIIVETQKRNIQILPGEPAWVICDVELIKRVITNLVNNAVKFTPENGEIKISIDKDNGNVRLSVSDTGKGIPQEYHKKIFSKFAQVDPEHKKLGFGLGLAFCKLAVEANGGEIGFESASGIGSTFWFKLPAQ